MNKQEKEAKKLGLQLGLLIGFKIVGASKQKVENQLIECGKQLKKLKEATKTKNNDTH